jgi:hypothetical protein
MPQKISCVSSVYGKEKWIFQRKLAGPILAAIYATIDKRNYLRELKGLVKKSHSGFSTIRKTIPELCFRKSFMILRILFSMCGRNALKQFDNFRYYHGDDFNTFAASIRLKPAYSLRYIKRFFKDKTIAIVGNAESLHNHKFGPEIDKHEIVVRINKALITNAESQGTKCDVISSGSPQIPLSEIWRIWVFSG